MSDKDKPEDQQKQKEKRVIRLGLDQSGPSNRIQNPESDFHSFVETGDDRRSSISSTSSSQIATKTLDIWGNSLDKLESALRELKREHANAVKSKDQDLINYFEKEIQETKESITKAQQKIKEYIQIEGDTASLTAKSKSLKQIEGGDPNEKTPLIEYGQGFVQNAMRGATIMSSRVMTTSVTQAMLWRTRVELGLYIALQIFLLLLLWSTKEINLTYWILFTFLLMVFFRLMWVWYRNPN